ncbi:uncharacterized protein [Bemisia tabaci]|uniref:uncharacterized protein isoform X2 n=1 Tax=Bemisia tabaci TaxID=7038 RepID=UPI003B28CE3D
MNEPEPVIKMLGKGLMGGRRVAQLVCTGISVTIPTCHYQQTPTNEEQGVMPSREEEGLLNTTKFIMSKAIILSPNFSGNQLSVHFVKIFYGVLGNKGINVSNSSCFIVFLITRFAAH